MKRPVKKYMVHPGPMKSKTDRQIHWIGFRDLVRLYGVDPAECMNAELHNQMLVDHSGHMIHLYPDFNGNYKLPVACG